MPVVPIRRGWLIALFAGLFLVAHVAGQPKADPPKASAIKLPDGTIVFLTKTPDDANPPIDGVLLSAADFKALTDKSEQAKKAKTVAPSGVAIRGQVELRGEKPVAALTLTYSFRTTQPRTVIALGCQRAAVLSAKSGAGQLPVLNPPGDEGLTVFVDTAGEHSLTLTVEVPVTSRGTKNEIGFDMGLPRCAITTIELTKPPATGLKKLTIGTRISEGTPAKPLEIKTLGISVDAITTKPLPLGATDYLEMTWEKPSAPMAADTSRSIDADIAVRVEETSVETVAKLRLHGAVKEWPLQLPANADVVVERAIPSTVGTSADTATVVRPTDAARPTWTIRLPNDPTNPEWMATITVRQLRPKANDPKHRGPYAIGPFFSPVAMKQTGRIRISAPANIRLTYKPLAEIRRQDLPAGADDDLLAAFQYATLPTPVGNARAAAPLEIETRAAVVLPRVRPQYKLRLTAGGWQLDTVLRITPAPRGDVEQVLVEMPPGWQKRLEATPEEIVESVQVLKEGAGRTLAVKFISPQKAPFDLTLSSTFPIPPGAKELSIPLPRYPQTDERESKVSASVAEGLEVRGTGFATDSSHATTEPLKAVSGKIGAVTIVQGEFDRGLDRVDLVWQPYRPELTCEIRAEVTVQDRQTLVTQTILFKPTADDPRPVRIRGPQNAIVWQQSTPPLDPVDTVGSNEWEFRPPATSATKEFTLVVTFAVKHPPRADASQPVRIPLTLFWPELASRTETRVRVWGGTSGRRGELLNDGQWRELPPEPMPGRDSLPWFTLATSTGKVPLTLSLTETGDVGVPLIGIERGILLAAFADDGGATCRAKFLLSKWTGNSVEIQLPRAQMLEVYLDGKRVDGIVLSDTDQAIIQVPLPEARGKSATIELRYRAAMPRNARGVRTLSPPVIRGATYRNPLRWHLGADAGITPLLLTKEFTLELQWVWRGLGFAPSAASSPTELEQWFSAGAEADHADEAMWPVATADTIAARQSEPSSLTLILIPRFGWIAAISMLAFAIGYLASRLEMQWLGLVAGGFAIAAAIASVATPHPAAQVIAAMQPGFAALVLFLAGKSALGSYLRNRLNHLPAFSRGGASTPPLTSTREASGSRPSRLPRTLPIEATISSRPPSASKG